MCLLLGTTVPNEGSSLTVDWELVFATPIVKSYAQEDKKKTTLGECQCFAQI